MANLIYSVRQVFDKRQGYLNDNFQRYNIPVYQRGYKWTPQDVKTLLDDINNFSGDEEKFYCLQNITIVPDETEQHFNVVDGQQRLTTLSLILAHLDEKEIVFDKIQYSIRRNTHQFLMDYVYAVEAPPIAEQYDSWEALIKTLPNYDHQDIFYIYEASKTILHWLDEQKRIPTFEIEVFTRKILDRVQFIINNIPTGNEERIFGNLNSKRIPLDGADLVRAILITRVAQEEGKREKDLKNIVQSNEFRVRIGWQLDEISNWWSKKEVKQYFNSFITIKNDPKEQFNASEYPLNTLLMLYAEKEGEKVLTLNFYEKHKKATDLYKGLRKMNETLKDWYADREIYHYLGLLFSQFRSSVKIKDIWEKWFKSTSRSVFIDDLKELLKEKIYGEDIDWDSTFSIDKNWYHQDKRRLIQTLLLLDIIEVVEHKAAAHLPPSSFSKTNNDIEHIFPQKPDDDKYLKTYLEYLYKYGVNSEDYKDASDYDLVKRYDSEHNSETESENYREEVDDFIEEETEDIKIHSIGNLVLLYASLNRSMRNKPYSIKRNRIIDYYNQGNFIQPHTFKVFARYFDSTSNYDLEHWNKSNIKANNSKIKERVQQFFNITK